MNADVVVVGSGAGGSAVAGRLLRAGASVVLVEAGGPVAPGPSWHGRNSFPAELDLGQFADFLARTLSPFAGTEPAPRDLPGVVVAHALGGTMVTWTNNCPTPHPTLEQVTGVPADELAVRLEQARTLLSVSDEITREGVRQTRLLGRAAEMYPHATRPPGPMPLAARFEDGRPRYSAAGDLLGGDGTEPVRHLTVLTDHIARRLAHHDGHARHLEVASRAGGPSLHLSADHFVLAGGAIGTPKLLLASGIDAGPALGCYLTDHAHICSSVILSRALRADVPADDQTVAVLFPVDDGHLLQTEIVKFPMPVSDVRADVNPLHRVDVFTTVGIQPRADNRLTFDSKHRDDFGLPRFGAQFKMSPADEHGVRDATAEHVRVVQGITDSQDGWSMTVLRAGESTHLLGTHRIGESDDGTSVTSSHGRLWRSDNIWLAGNGLLNGWSACNPSLTTVALGLRTADAITSARTR